MTPDGERALRHTQTYVAACRSVATVALTVEQVDELYRAEDGLRLAALDADSAALAAAAVAADGALDAGRAAYGVLSAAWQSRTGWAATDFLNRQCESAAQVISGLRTTADTLRALRAELATLVDAKIDAAVRIDDRRADQRGLWLTEAAAVLGGVADDGSIGIVQREIAPYVATDIAGDWVTAMQSTTEAVRAAYDGAVRSLNDRTPAGFEFPAVSVAAPPARTVRSRSGPGPRALGPAPEAVTAPVPPPAPPIGLPAAPALGALGADPGATSMPPLWSPPPPDTLADRGSRRRQRRRDTEPDDTEPDDTKPQHTEPADAGPADPAGGTAGATPPGSPVGTPPAQPAPLMPEQPVAQPDATPDAAPLLPAEAPADTSVEDRTPCEIAIDELPQVGG